MICEEASYTTPMSDWDVKKAIGANLEAIREELHLTQEEFGDRLGTDQSTISLWETGARLPRLQQLVERLEKAKIDPRPLVPTQAKDVRRPAEHDPDISQVSAGMRDLAPDIRHALAELVDRLRVVMPRDYDAESAELMRILSTVDPVARAGVLRGVRQTLSALGIE